MAPGRTEGLNHHSGSGGQSGAKRNSKAKRNHDDDEDEFRFEAEIEKWVSETEGEESEDTEEDSSDSTVTLCPPHLVRFKLHHNVDCLLLVFSLRSDERLSAS